MLNLNTFINNANVEKTVLKEAIHYEKRELNDFERGKIAGIDFMMQQVLNLVFHFNKEI